MNLRFLICFSALVFPLLGGEPARPTSPSTSSADLAQLRQLLADQQRQIDELRKALAAQQQVLEAVTHTSGSTNGTQVASLAPVIPPSTASATTLAVAPSPQAVVATPSSSADTQIRSQIESVARGLNGFRFSGDFRYRFDMQLRSGNEIAPPLQNMRSRYRLRLNIDKDLNEKFRFHTQLSTGPYATETTNDQDFSGLGVKHPFSVAEAWANYTPNKTFAFRVGRMEEVFADNSRFLWDDDIRFDGFEEIVRMPFNGSKGAFNALELRAGEYILTNPNVAILSASSPFVSAGYQVGTRIGASNLFHPGVVLRGNLSENWTHQIIADAQIYRNVNQVALASTTSGFPVVVSNAIGLALSGPIGATGNALTSSGGAIYSATGFQIPRLSYRLDSRSMITLRGKPVPGFLDFQVARNVAAPKLHDAFMATASVGAVRKAGDLRFLYQYAIKDANSLVSQFTDDDLGTGAGVNIAVHGIRLDVGLTRFLQFQNLLFIQNARRPTNPQDLFFVPIQRGANDTFRYLGQLAFTF